MRNHAGSRSAKCDDWSRGTVIMMGWLACMLAGGRLAAQSSETSPIWDIKVAITVPAKTSSCNTPCCTNPGTDDPLRLRLNDVNETWLNAPGNDFEPGSSREYHLLLHGVQTPQDIKYLRIDKAGTDGVCLTLVRMDINHQPVYVKDLRDIAGYSNPGLFLDGDATGRTVTLTDLRNYSGWQTIIGGGRLPGSPTSLSSAEFFHRAVAVFGHIIASGAAGWVSGANAPVSVGFRDLSGFSNQHKTPMTAVPPYYQTTRGTLLLVDGLNVMRSRIRWGVEVDFSPGSTTAPTATNVAFHNWFRDRVYAATSEDAAWDLSIKAGGTGYMIARDLGLGSEAELVRLLKGAFFDATRASQAIGLAATAFGYSAETVSKGGLCESALGAPCVLLKR